VPANLHTRVCICVDCRAHASQFSATSKALSERSQSNDIKEDYKRQGTRRTLGKIGTCFYQFNKYLLLCAISLINIYYMTVPAGVPAGAINPRVAGLGNIRYPSRVAGAGTGLKLISRV
jgi:hypothetical protein